MSTSAYFAAWKPMCTSLHLLEEQMEKVARLGCTLPVKAFEGKHEVLRELVWEVCGNRP
jgi:hypothetical protein